MPSVEEASHCPKCDQVGRVDKTSDGPRRSKVMTFVCANKLCLWFNTGWIVQIGSDGSIPDRRQGPKEFEISSFADSIARRQLEEIAMADPSTRGAVDKVLEENG